VVEHGPFGGTCLNRGCIPSKMLIHSADVMETIQRAELFGIKAEVSAVDWDFIIKRASDTVDGDAQTVEEGNRQHPKISVFGDTARFVGDRTLAVGGERISAETIVIAAGTRPRVPDIEGIRDVPYVTSDEALRLPKQPRRLIILGGGYIAAELAHFFGALGTEVTIVNRGPRLLRQEDDDVAVRFTGNPEQGFSLIRSDPNVTNVEVNSRGCTVEMKGSDAGVQRLLRQLVAADCGLISFAEKEPTLEDVFMMVTKGLVT
ncbi:MAG: FAD-dependent oxidoreductase, partial [Planctomycetes bacterium]|nr:FAD-dependent oxidoreductase [Planctomycetota bacterium]